jgi:hypothetical protein
MGSHCSTQWHIHCTQTVFVPKTTMFWRTAEVSVARRTELLPQRPVPVPRFMPQIKRSAPVPLPYICYGLNHFARFLLPSGEFPQARTSYWLEWEGDCQREGYCKALFQYTNCPSYRVPHISSSHGMSRQMSDCCATKLPSLGTV